MTSPPISVLLPIRNGEKYVDEIVNSILRNVSGEDEIVIINDGSTDETGTKLDSLKGKFPNFKIVETSGLGIVSALNIGIRTSKHEWIARFDADDRYPHNRLQECRSFLQTPVVAVFTDYKITNERDANLGVIPSAVYAELVPISLYSSSRTAHPSVIFNKTAVLNVGGYFEEDFPAEDLSLWLRIAQVGSIISVPKILLNYTLHNDSISSSKRTEMQIKTQKLLRDSEISPLFVIQSLDFLRKNGNLYESIDFPEKRKLLIIRDFLLLFKCKKNLWKKLPMDSKINFIIVVSTFLIDYKNIKCGKELLLDYFNRHLNRKRFHNAK